MAYQIVYPITMSINGDSFKDAVKNFAKLNYSMNLNSIVLTDQARYMKADLNYYRNDNKYKVGISLFPTVWPLSVQENGQILSPLQTWPYSPSISFDTKEYPATRFFDASTFVPRIIPLDPLVAPLGSAIPPFFSPFSPLSPIAPVVYRY